MTAPDQPIGQPLQPTSSTAGGEPDTPATVTRWERWKPRVRLIGSAVIAVLAVLTLAFLVPAGSDDMAAERALIWVEDSANNERTEGAPQQAVVNGWTTNQLLDLVSRQLEAGVATDHRPAALLTLGILLLAIIGVTTPRGKDGEIVSGARSTRWHETLPDAAGSADPTGP